MDETNCERCIHFDVCDRASRLIWARLGKEKVCSDFMEAKRWIPVTERLPEEVLKEIWDEKPHTASALVLVAVRDDCDRRFVSDDITFDGKWCNYPSPDFEVTHWMPLPEPPKEG